MTPDIPEPASSGRTARLYAVIARKARRAVVFRRGPSRQVLVLSWNLRDDSLLAGQWFKGRIRERRCDLSPDGNLLGYFAARHHGPLGTWTAISRPPFLTALALWPKGDSWGGGLLFQDDRTLLLNHPPGDGMVLGKGFALPAGYEVRPLWEQSGAGEDDPIQTMRLQRDGWVLTSPGIPMRGDRQLRWRLDPPRVFEKALRCQGTVLRVGLHGVFERNGRARVQTGQVIGPDGVLEDLGQVDWADADSNGDVLFARNGCLFRRKQRHVRPGPQRPPAVLVADLNDLRFEPCPPPDEALLWPKPARR